MQKKLLLLLLFLTACVPTGTNTNVITQYAGALIPCGNYEWMYQYIYPISQSNEAIIGDYKVITELSSSQTIYQLSYCNTLKTAAYNTTICPDSCSCVSMDDSICYYPQGSFQDSCCRLHRYQITRGWTQIEIPEVLCSGQSTKDEYGCDKWDDCGGAVVKIAKSGSDCYSRHKIYYKGGLVNETAWVWSDLNLYFKDGQQVPMGQEDFKATLHRSDQYYGRSERVSCKGYDHGYEVNKGCQSIRNEYIVKVPDTKFTAEVQDMTYTDKLKYSIKINNELDDMTIVLSTKITSYYTYLGNPKEMTDTLMETADIPKGEKVLTYEQPIEVNANKITISPKITLLKGGVTGVNYVCYAQIDSYDQDVSNCPISLGTMEIAPKSIETSYDCDVKEDCKTKCDSITSDCIDGKCSFSGECRDYTFVIVLSILIGIGFIALLFFAFRKF